MPTDARTADAFLAAPAGQALLALVEGHGLAPADLADPLTAVHLVTSAMDLISRWDPVTPARLERLALDSPARRPLAERLASAPELDWWFAPLDRDAQLWSSLAGSDYLEPGLDRATAGPLSGFERYAHKPTPSILTSSAVADDLSSLIVASVLGSNDMQPHPFEEIRRTRLAVRPHARVYEITGPAAWAALARRYPAIDPGNHHQAVNADGSLEPGEPPEVVPDWPAVARDWDGVHVSLGAVLLATDVRVEDETGMSRLWAWNAEGTYWLRWAFSAANPLPDLDPGPIGLGQLDPIGDRPGHPALDVLWRSDLLMAGTGPEARKLRSSSAVSTTWQVTDGPRRRRGPPWWWKRFGWLVGR